MPRLLFLVTEDWYFVSHRLSLAQAAREAGFDVVVVTRPGRERKTIETAGIRLVPFDIDRSGMNPVKEFRTLWRLIVLLRREQPDLIHLVALKPVLLGNLAARIAGLKHRVSAVAGLGFLFADTGRGGVLMPMVQRLLGWALRGSMIIVQNPDDRRLLEERIGIPASTLRLIRGAGVELDRFKLSPEPNSDPVVMLASRLLWDKGVGEFVEAARRLKVSGRSARFVLAGAPDPANPASINERQLQEWVAEGIVEWWGHQEDMASVFPKVNVVCLPSYREGLPKALLEAAACGRAIVTTDVPGCRDVVRDGENGLLVPPRDPEALAAAICRLLEDPELRKRMGRAGRRRAEQEFSAEKINAETLRIYDELLSNSKRLA